MKDLWERNQEDIEVWIKNMIEWLSHLTLHLPIIYTQLLHSLQRHRLYCNMSLSAIVRALYSNNIWPIQVCPMNCFICLWHFGVELISICFGQINEPPMMANRMVICLASLSPSCGWKQQITKPLTLPAAKARQVANVQVTTVIARKRIRATICGHFCCWISPGQIISRHTISQNSTHSTIALGTTKGHTICTSRSCASGPKCCLAASMAISTNTTPDISLMHRCIWT